jgi:hypothetical protein
MGISYTLFELAPCGSTMWFLIWKTV